MMPNKALDDNFDQFWPWIICNTPLLKICDSIKWCMTSVKAVSFQSLSSRLSWNSYVFCPFYQGVFLSFFHKIIYWFRIFFSNFLFPGILQVSLSLVNITLLFFSLSYECLPFFLYYLLSASNFSSRLNLKKTDQMCATHQIPSMSTKPNKINAINIGSLQKNKKKKSSRKFQKVKPNLHGPTILIYTSICEPNKVNKI